MVRNKRTRGAWIGRPLVVAGIAALLAAAISAGTASAAGPTNDNFAAAQAVTGATGSITGSNVGATLEPGEPVNPPGTPVQASIWYGWTAPGNGTATFNTLGSNFDTVMAVYTGSTLGGLTVLDYSDDYSGYANTPNRHDSLVSFSATAGTTYRIQVDGFVGGVLAGQGSLTLNWTGPAAAPTGCSVAVCVLNPSANGALNVNGGATITVHSLGSSLTPGVAVNSSSNDAADVSGGALVAADAGTKVHGNYHTSGGGRFTALVSPAVSGGQASVTDPFASLPDPAIGASHGDLNANGNMTASPGTYNSINVQGGAHLTLSPGVYVITGNLQTGGSARLTGTGVTLYFTKGGIHFSGGSTVDITAPTSGTYAGISVFFARTDKSDFTSDGAPTPADPDTRQIDGAIYAKASAFNIQVLDADGQVVVDTVNVHSGGFLSVSA